MKILKKLRTARLNSEFTGSYKKIVMHFIRATIKLYNQSHNNIKIIARKIICIWQITLFYKNK